MKTFHENTLKALAEVVAAAGLSDPAEIQPNMLRIRQKTGEVLQADEAYPRLAEGELLGGTDHPGFRDYWAEASATRFGPAS